MSTDTHDMASNVARLAGIAAPSAATPITPAALIARFCTGADAAYSGTGGSTSTEGRVTVSKGFCGYIGGRGDLMTTGFDDGYVFMGHLGERGWRDLPRKGDWPYVVYLRWLARGDDSEAIVEYCEADLTVWQFTDHADAAAFYATLKDS